MADLKGFWSLLGISLLVSVASAAECTRPGDIIQECVDCPKLIHVPAGFFAPAHPFWDMKGAKQKTQVNAFAAGMYEITLHEFSTFVEETGYEQHSNCGKFLQGDSFVERRWDSPGWTPSPEEPAFCISWDDTQAYLSWISEKTGSQYRLPSDLEWQYLSQEGGSENKEPEFGKAFFRPNSVGHDRSNAFGLYDMYGNAREWVDDCRFIDGYNIPGNICVLRGYAWTGMNRKTSFPDHVYLHQQNSNHGTGFRLVRNVKSCAS